jgi:CcmD family protein
MGTLAIAYVVAWMGVASYTSWIAVANRRLARRLDALEAQRSAAADDPTRWRAVG